MSTHGCRDYMINDVRNGFDEVIGGQCSRCLTVLYGVGTCHGCGKGKANLRLVIGEDLRYCGPDCRAAELKRAREKANMAIGSKAATK